MELVKDRVIVVMSPDISVALLIYSFMVNMFVL